MHKKKKVGDIGEIPMNPAGSLYGRAGSEAIPKNPDVPGNANKSRCEFDQR